MESIEVKIISPVYIVEAVSDADGCQAGKREYFCKQSKDKGLSLAVEAGFEYSG